MATRKIACLLLAAVLALAACSKRAKPEAVTPSASTAKEAEPPSQRTVVDVPAGRPAAGDPAAPSGDVEQDPGAEGPAQEESPTGARGGSARASRRTLEPSEVEASSSARAGTRAPTGAPGDSTPGRRQAEPGILRGVRALRGHAPRAQAPEDRRRPRRPGCVQHGCGRRRPIGACCSTRLGNTLGQRGVDGQGPRTRSARARCCSRSCSSRRTVTSSHASPSSPSGSQRELREQGFGITHNVRLYPNRHEGMNKTDPRRSRRGAAQVRQSGPDSRSSATSTPG